MTLTQALNRIIKEKEKCYKNGKKLNKAAKVEIRKEILFYVESYYDMIRHNSLTDLVC